MNRVNFENALVQMLENFQRCGVSRFGAMPLDELPTELRSAVAQLVAADVPAAQTATAPPSRPVTSAAGAQFGSGGDAGRPQLPYAAADRASGTAQVASTDQPPMRPSVQPPRPSGSQTAGELVPLVGLAAQPWGLPVLAEPQRQEPLELLAGKARECRLCSAIVSYRQQTVFGTGSLSPRVCFAGEAPGAEEDRSGQPFVGPAGQLLTKIISAMKLSRDEVYILNALKCRPPQNRTPLNEEIEHCRHFVESQLDLLQPEFIVCLGAVAVRSILQTELPIGRLRGQFYRYRGARVVVTYHPSYLLRNESAKRMVWDDMKMLMAEL